MPEKIALAVKEGISQQMAYIREMAESVNELSKAAEASNNDSLRQIAREMAAQLKALSQKAYDVGAKVLDAA